MREYAHKTLVAYRSRLKLLKLALEEGVIEQDDVKLVTQEIVELEAKLGPNAVSPTKQGRPRKFVKLTMAEVEALRAGREVDKLAPAYWSNEAVEMRRKIKQMQIGPTQEEVDASAKELEEMKKAAELIDKANESLGGDENAEGPKQATDDAGKAG